jgi:signal transduction histidine kinase
MNDTQEDNKTNEALNPFRPRARLIRALGQELISNETVAIIELVKNSYDADATRVKIRFTEPLQEGKGSIEIVDNGNGMNLAIVRSSFLEPATSSKRGGKSKRKSERLKRHVLGEKGIGRFASSRLADELELFTRSRNSDQEVYGLFDWEQFDDDDLYLDEVLVLTEERDPIEICPNGTTRSLWQDDESPRKSELSQGTVLRMNNLLKGWERSDFEVLERGLSRLVSPFKRSADFRVFLELPEEFSDISAEVESPTLIKFPHYSVKGTVKENGSYDLRFRVYETDDHSKEETGVFVIQTDGKKAMRSLPSQKQAEELAEEVRNPACGEFDVELRFWDRDQLGNIQQQENSSSITDIRRDLDAISGLNIYRDDFRVLPYGEPNDDWLRLDIRRVQKPQQRFSNNNIAGYVKISSQSNPNLVDQTNREGLDENQALKDLRSILIHVVSMVELKRQLVRPKLKGKKSTTPVGGIFEPLDLGPLRRQLLLTYPDDTEVNAVLDETEKNFSTQLEEIQSVLGRYHALATLGKLIDVVLHDGRHPVATVVTQSELATRTIENSKIEDCEKKIQRVKSNVEKIRNQGELLRTLFKRIEPFGGRKRGKPTPLYLEQIVENTVAVFSGAIKRLAIKITLPNSETLVRVDESEIQEVLANLLDNSLHWLQETPESKRKIEVAIKRISSDNVEIIIADSGPGVKAANRAHIFDPYFSTKPNGVGLGLSIAGEIVKDYYDGELELVDGCPLGGAMFRITLRKRV